MVPFLLLLVVVLAAWSTSLTKRLNKLNEKLKPITDAEAYAKATRKLADSDLSKARQEAKATLDSLMAKKLETEKGVEAHAKATRQLADSELSKAKEEAKSILNGISTKKTRAGANDRAAPGPVKAGRG
jgi:F0F1-type ATP synthase membrane subunit b/b'